MNIGMYVKHPLVKEYSIEYREYQVEAVKKAIKSNTLIVLPTGTGKTVIAALLTAEWLFMHGEDAMVILIAPTKPLVVQHEKLFRQILKIDPFDLISLSGEYPPSKRRDLWNRKIIIATPQVVYNDLIKNVVKINEKLLIIVDEAHRAVGSHPYVKIVEYIMSAYPHITIRVVALTASPGSKEKTKNIMNNLNIKNLFILSQYDQKIKKYFPGYDINPIFIHADTYFYYLIGLLKRYLGHKVDEYNSLVEHINRGLKINQSKISYTYIDQRRKDLEDLYISGLLDTRVRSRLKRILYQILILDKLLSYVETYSYKYAYDYIRKLQQKSRRGAIAEKEILGSSEISEFTLILKKIVEENTVYPKQKKLYEILSKETFERALVFTSIRQVANEIKEYLLHNNISCNILIGQRKESGFGLSQREQINILNSFKKGIYKVIVATQIGEEGLDISEVDYVIFYDNPVSAIRRIQRMGRTGRRRRGAIFFLVMKNTRDESRYWAGLKKEIKLYRELKSARPIGYNNIEKIDKYIMGEKVEVSSTISKLMDKDNLIIVDYREHATDIINLLKINGFNVVLDDLPVGDYQIGNIIIERKSMNDLATSLVEGRLFNQLKRLKNLKEYNVLLVIEGSLSEFTKRSSLPVFIGTILSILFDYKIPIYLSNNYHETFELIKNIYKRVSERKMPTIKLRMDKKPYGIKDIQKFVLAGIPGIDNVLAERLLSHFKSLSNIANAPISELMNVKGIGKELAVKIYKVFHEKFIP